MNLIQKILWAPIIFLPTLCLAGPPFLTDDPSPAPYQHWQIIGFTNGIHNYQGTSIAFPGLELDYGILPKLEINTVLSYGHNFSQSPLLPEADGIGDTQLGFKYELWEQTPSHPQLGFAPIYYIPTGNNEKGLGNGKGWYMLPLWLQRTWGTWTCYGGGGYAINSGATMRNYFFGGALLQKQISDKWMLGGEVFSQGTSSRYISALTFLNLGGFYIFNSHLQALFSLGHTFIGTSSSIGYLGLQWNT